MSEQVNKISFGCGKCITGVHVSVCLFAEEQMRERD